MNKTPASLIHRLTRQKAAERQDVKRLFIPDSSPNTVDTGAYWV